MKNVYLMFLLISTNILSQKIYITGEKCKAEYDVIFTREKCKADICMKTVAYPYQAGRSKLKYGCDNWYFVQNEMDADYVMRIVTSVHQRRKTLFVYRNSESNYVPALRDRNDPKNQYKYDDQYKLLDKKYE